MPPLLKLGLLLVRTLSKPVSNYAKREAREREWFRKWCINFAQGYHRFEHRVKVDWLKYDIGEVKVLSDLQATNLGADILGEAVIFAIAAAVLIFESSRSTISENKRKREIREAIEDLQDKEYVLHEKMELIAAENRRLRQELDGLKYYLSIPVDFRERQPLWLPQRQHQSSIFSLPDMSAGLSASWLEFLFGPSHRSPASSSSDASSLPASSSPHASSSSTAVTPASQQSPPAPSPPLPLSSPPSSASRQASPSQSSPVTSSLSTSSSPLQQSEGKVSNGPTSTEILRAPPETVLASSAKEASSKETKSVPGGSSSSSSSSSSSESTSSGQKKEPNTHASAASVAPMARSSSPAENSGAANSDVITMSLESRQDVFVKVTPARAEEGGVETVIYPSPFPEISTTPLPAAVLSAVTKVPLPDRKISTK